MSESRGVAIDIYIQSSAKKVERYAFRRWHQVPRVGEFVELRNPDKGDGFHLAEVFRIQWGEIDEKDQCAAVFCRWK